MALFVHGVPRGVLVPLLLLPLLLAVYFSSNKLMFRRNSHPDADLEMENQVLKMVTEDITVNEELQMTRNKKVQFDYYIMEQGYPPSICREKKYINRCITPWPQDFILHGFWPSNENTRDPINCPGEAFDPNKIKGLDMHIYWPSLMKEMSNDQFWKQEWDRHGKCSNLNQTEYFKAAVWLHHYIELYYKLGMIDIIPGKDYDSYEVVEMYGKNYKGIKPKISCGTRTTMAMVEVMSKFQFKVNKINLTLETMRKPYTDCQLNSVAYPK